MISCFRGLSCTQFLPKARKFSVLFWFFPLFITQEILAQGEGSLFFLIKHRENRYQPPEATRVKTFERTFELGLEKTLWGLHSQWKLEWAKSSYAPTFLRRWQVNLSGLKIGQQSLDLSFGDLDVRISEIAGQFVSYRGGCLKTSIKNSVPQFFIGRIPNFSGGTVPSFKTNRYFFGSSVQTKIKDRTNFTTYLVARSDRMIQGLSTNFFLPKSNFVFGITGEYNLTEKIYLSEEFSFSHYQNFSRQQKNGQALKTGLSYRTKSISTETIYYYFTPNYVGIDNSSGNQNRQAFHIRSLLRPHPYFSFSSNFSRSRKDPVEISPFQRLRQTHFDTRLKITLPSLPTLNYRYEITQGKEEGILSIKRFFDSHRWELVHRLRFWEINCAYEYQRSKERVAMQEIASPFSLLTLELRKRLLSGASLWFVIRNQGGERKSLKGSLGGDKRFFYRWWCLGEITFGKGKNGDKYNEIGLRVQSNLNLPANFVLQLGYEAEFFTFSTPAKRHSSNRQFFLEFSKHLDFKELRWSGVEGYVFNDVNRNGKFDLEDSPVRNVKIKFDNKIETNTDKNGYYHFGNVTLGKHKVKLDLRSLPAGYNPASPLEEEVVNRGFWKAKLNFTVTTLGYLAGKVFYDLNYNGLPDTNEAGIPNVLIRLKEEKKIAYTDNEGYFDFSNVPSGRYTILLDKETLPLENILTTPESLEVILAPKERIYNLYFGVMPKVRPIKKVFLPPKEITPPIVPRVVEKKPKVEEKGLKEKIEALRKEGIELFFREDYERALLIWQKILKLDPKNAKAKQMFQETKMRLEKLK